MTLYELTDEWMALLEMMDDPEIDEQTILDTMESVGGEIEDKAEAYAKIIRELESRISGIKAEVDRLTSRRRTMEANIDRMKRTLQDAMVITGKTKFRTALFSFGIQKNGGALPVIIDVPTEELPDDLLIIRKDPDKKAIAERIENDPTFTQAHFGERGESLRIR